MVNHEVPATLRSIHDLSFNALEGEMAPLSRVHVGTLWRALYRDPEMDIVSRRDFLPPLRRWTAATLGPGGRFSTACSEVTAEIASRDGLTRKFLLRLTDSSTVEMVLMGYPGRFTACVSTQAGCAMGCSFCATGQMGFTRHLQAGEIVAQVLHAQRALRASGQNGLRNVVLMGMGEPLHNYDSVMTALEIITDSRGLNLGPSRITISTVGVVPGILRLTKEPRPYRLAVSLHAATQADRAALIPASRRWPLPELIAACRSYAETTGRRIFFEWILIEGVNDSPAEARQLATLLAGLNGHVNLIPLNPTRGFGGVGSASSAAARFQQILRRKGFPTTIRQRRGIDVAAGCGQLRAANE